MSERVVRTDVLVIGGGLAGLMAAAAAREQGARVTLLAQGAGALELSSGAIDLLGRRPDGTPVRDPWDALATLASEVPDHPYARLGLDAVSAGLTAFQRLCEPLGSPYYATADQSNQWLVTPAGCLRPTYLAPATMMAPCAGEAIWVAGFRELRDYHPAVIAAGLKRSLPDALLSWSWVDLPDSARRTATGDLHPVTLARLIDNPVFLAQLATNLARALPPGSAPQLALLPAVMGIDRSAGAMAKVGAAVEARVSEVPLLPPSIPGFRLAEGLRRRVQRDQIEICQGVLVQSARTAGVQVAAVRGEAAGGPVEYQADAFVLAGGGMLGGGLMMAGGSPVEPIFGLPVQSPKLEDWSQVAFLPSGGQPFTRVGVAVNDRLQPDGWRNLYLCGRMLAGYDPYAEGCGGGVAVASGWLAGRLAGGAAR